MTTEIQRKEGKILWKKIQQNKITENTTPNKTTPPPPPPPPPAVLTVIYAVLMGDVRFILCNVVIEDGVSWTRGCTRVWVGVQGGGG